MEILLFLAGAVGVHDWANLWARSGSLLVIANTANSTIVLVGSEQLFLKIVVLNLL